jgi:hypothetical protein
MYLRMPLTVPAQTTPEQFTQLLLEQLHTQLAATPDVRARIWLRAHYWSLVLLLERVEVSCG